MLAALVGIGYAAKRRLVDGEVSLPMTVPATVHDMPTEIKVDDNQSVTQQMHAPGVDAIPQPSSQLVQGHAV